MSESSASTPHSEPDGRRQLNPDLSAGSEHAAILLAFVNETNEDRVPSYDQVEAAVYGLVEQYANLARIVNEREVSDEEFREKAMEVFDV